MPSAGGCFRVLCTLQAAGPASLTIQDQIEAAAHGAFARAARANVHTDDLETPPILPRRHTDEHLRHDPTIQRVGVRNGLKMSAA